MWRRQFEVVPEGRRARGFGRAVQAPRVQRERERRAQGRGQLLWGRYELFCVTFAALDSIWASEGATRTQFGEIIGKTKV